MMENKDGFKTYDTFWPFYLSQHSKRSGRLLHVWGTLLALTAILKAVVPFSFGWLFVAPVIGYGFAWVAHVFVEKNKPATFSYPFWSLKGDVYMLWFWLTGRLEIELVQHNIFT